MTFDGPTGTKMVELHRLADVHRRAAACSALLSLTMPIAGVLIGNWAAGAVGLLFGLALAWRMVEAAHALELTATIVHLRHANETQRSSWVQRLERAGITDAEVRDRLAAASAAR